MLTYKFYAFYAPHSASTASLVFNYVLLKITNNIIASARGLLVTSRRLATLHIWFPLGETKVKSMEER